jgi:hypothetical protein
MRYASVACVTLTAEATHVHAHNGGDKKKTKKKNERPASLGKTIRYAGRRETRAYHRRQTHLALALFKIWTASVSARRRWRTVARRTITSSFDVPASAAQSTPAQRNETQFGHKTRATSHRSTIRTVDLSSRLASRLTNAASPRPQPDTSNAVPSSATASQLITSHISSFSWEPTLS